MTCGSSPLCLLGASLGGSGTLAGKANAYKAKRRALGWSEVCGIQSLLCTVVNDVDGL